MNFVSSSRSAFRAIQVNKLRSFLTVLGIVLGVSSVIIMMAVGSGARLRIQNDIKSLGSNVIILTAAALATGGVSRGAGSKPSITIGDLEAIRTLPGVVAAAPQQNASSAQIISGSANWSSPLVGSTPDYFIARGWQFASGGPFDLEDAQNGSKVALLGKTVAEKLFGNDDPIGREIRINRIPVQVVGVLKSKGQSATGYDIDDITVIPLATFLTRVVGRNPANPRSISTGVIKLREEFNIAAVLTEIRNVMRDLHGLQPGQLDDFQLLNLTEVLKTQDESAKNLGFMLATIAGISLLVGGIGVMNIMLVSITERTKEIGLRLAVGARRGHILSQFLIEATTLSLIGGFLGLTIGVGGSLLVERYTKFSVVLDLELSLVAIAFAGAVGIVFGFYPANKASRLQPVEALHHE